MKTSSITYKVLDYKGIKGNERIVTVTELEDIERVLMFRPEELGIEILSKNYGEVE